VADSHRQQIAVRALQPGFALRHTRTLQREIFDEVLARSEFIRQPDFEEIHPRDLRFLYAAYDDRFFEGLCRRAVAPGKLAFRLSPRMTRAAGTTTYSLSRSGVPLYEIAVSVSLLFDGFGPEDRTVTVAGLPCSNRLEALQRVFEHELVHLVEFVAWRKSNCRAKRFETIARGLFGHREFTHQLITRRERAADIGIVTGSLVTFDWEGKQLTGRVNRITKRATVLVEDPAGQQYSDGRHYLKFYIPLPMLTWCDKPAGPAG